MIGNEHVTAGRVYIHAVVPLAFKCEEWKNQASDLEIYNFREQISLLFLRLYLITNNKCSQKWPELLFQTAGTICRAPNIHWTEWLRTTNYF